MIIAISALLALLGYHFWDEIGLEKIFDRKDSSPQPGFEDNWEVAEEVEWLSGGQGLELTVVNSLTDDWDKYFTETIADWGASPSLSLTTTEIKGKEDSCSHRAGVMNVCNAEYGKTTWKGLNEYSYYRLQDSDKKYIISSLAIMNDSYLIGTSDAEKLYVMCHEIGHGYGLQHRDTNLRNTNLGTCMDYTLNFENTSKPDDVDFQNLFELYGIFGTRRHLRENNKNQIGVVKRQLEQGNILERRKVNNFRRGRILHRSKFREVYESYLGDGLSVVTMLLLVTEDEDIEP